ncbi:hypothetical protein CCM_03892 [Cordyceps militaris CM01]|uniref:Uncharacterized protein n=1 Tax=Cordyceps militaris (strain CM01) TaxID=983644 RepID=G3JCZ1_CORMM|nr:uncharacterized protein CCM_03892 [Cordyceps militaris CM01]EGX92519.1 hypothetical protein CCM_03892 [Cordyceps militaris CM01]
MFSIRAAVVARRVSTVRRQLATTRTYATEKSNNPTPLRDGGFLALDLLTPCRSAESFAARILLLTVQPPQASFYKTFSRPIAKVMILAVFTYQVAYWSWIKLEADEARAKVDAEIETLEKTVTEYKESKAAAETGPMGSK